MKKGFYCIIGIFTLLIILFPTVVNANIVCNDGTVSPSCSDCHKGCCSKHGGCSSGASNNSSSSSGTTDNYSNNNSLSSDSNYAVQYSTKSNDNSIRRVTVNSEEIDVSDSMSYSTTKEKAIIYVVATDYKATTEYNSNAKLTIGDNIIDIKVTAENGDVKEYKLNIIREKVLSNNKNIKIIVDDEELIFNLFESKTIYLSNSKNKIDLKYELEDKNAKVEIIGNENLKVGENEVVVKVIAENGEGQDYTIIVDKYSKWEETIFNMVGTTFAIGFFGGICYLIYCFIRKIKKK